MAWEDLPGSKIWKMAWEVCLNQISLHWSYFYPGLGQDMMEADRLGEGSLSGVTARVKCDKTSGSQSGLLYQTYSNSHKKHTILCYTLLCCLQLTFNRLQPPFTTNKGQNGANHGKFRSSWEVMRKSWEIYEKVMRRSWGSQEKVMRKSWESHKKVMRKS